MTTIETPRHRSELHLPYGSAADGPDLVTVTPERAGWSHAGLRVVELLPGQRVELETGECEYAILPLSGGAVTVETGGERYELPARVSVFARPSGFVYVGREQEVALSSEDGAILALPHAGARRNIAAYAVSAAEVSVEIRGAGSATRQLNNFLSPDGFEADRLTAVEVITPRGNWSSYPPHKHDVDNPPVEVDLEEVYYYRMKQPDGYGFQRLYTADGSRDATLKVEDGDVVLIRDGYHPYVSAYGVDSYYLNVLAGTRRSMAASDDPRYAPLRASWPPPDPRVPVVPRPI